MGYSGYYSLLYRCISECLGTFMFVFLLETVLANKLLPKTKGHDVGFGWVAVGAGFAVFLPVQFFGYISTSVNPAMALGSAVAGFIDWQDWPVIALSELIGAFLGAALVWVYYLPHFKTIPEPPPKREADRLLRTRDDIGRSALNYASYNTVPYSHAGVAGGILSLREYLRPGAHSPGCALRDEDILGSDAIKGRIGLQRRRSVTVADLYDRLHHRLRSSVSRRNRSTRRDVRSRASSANLDDPEPVTPQKVDAEECDTTTIDIDSPPRQTGLYRDVSAVSLHAIQEHDNHQGVYFCPMRGMSEASESPCQSRLYSSPTEYHQPLVGHGDDTEPTHASPFASSSDFTREGAPQRTPQSRKPKRSKLFWLRKSLKLKKTAKEKEDVDDLDTAHAGKLYEASRIADQNAKLAVFCTRPAVYSPFANLVTEMVATCFLVLGILFINQRAGMMYEGERHLYVHGIKSLYVGLLIMVLVLSLGGTGVAMNPARDLGPRLVHSMLPIAGKGPSEWFYAWIPVVGPFIGGVLGGFLYMLIDKLNGSNVEGGFYDDIFKQDF